ncbi:Panacea domain-containing protein [Puia sp. P3]|uniref:Panacea domain-containing protein n=1 Tax=Puia sp. P3 TaxID=3423952 RepID=UPI003D67BE9A
MENPLAIANYFIRKSIDSGEELTSMKLIKLVYISHGFYLALTGNSLLNEAVQAWKYGPVVKSVYQETKKYGSGPVTAYFVDSANNVPFPADKTIYPFLDKIWEIYGKFNGLQLSALTHESWYSVVYYME